MKKSMAMVEQLDSNCQKIGYVYIVVKSRGKTGFIYVIWGKRLWSGEIKELGITRNVFKNPIPLKALEA